jgi:flagellar basal body rod protein FlgG
MNDINSLAASLSGMLTAIAQSNAAAANRANQNTPGYKSIRTPLTSLPNYSGVAVGPFASNPLGGPTHPSGQDGSNLDLTSQIVQLDRSRILYDASAAVIRSSNRMTGTLLDIFAPDDES